MAGLQKQELELRSYAKINLALDVTGDPTGRLSQRGYDHAAGVPVGSYPDPLAGAGR